ncbi:flavin-containing monooxygenase [Meiothermus hypogaeus]|uniref:Oxidoreductase n=1 Tax=Meiothermus hypogaeus NBRC 106114 TaxID=1227553 RepID=A0A511QXX0_9DEIN|nr:NAD(P)/FAD-dependent oxidoreductase [Meiothermus hypogaeus]MBI5813078.1 NAD(P)-binding domain-containing protein [Allomeiothermus silvanus]GEM82229.1 oxidoreductase [Meiothermus hypogaeus NBRC 106114]
MSTFDTIVIGAGQAGLAMGCCLRPAGLNVVLLDNSERVSEAWRLRQASLRLFTPAQYDALPGLPCPAPAGHYPAKDEVADYLENYAHHFALPVQLQTQVTALEGASSAFVVRTNRGNCQTAQMAVATGPFQTPFTPAFAQQLDASIEQLHSSAYLNPKQLPKGEALVVGSGNSGLQIAEDLLDTHSVTLAWGRPQPFLPQRILGRSIFWWMERLGISRVKATSRLGKRLKQRPPVISSDLGALKRRGLKLAPRAEKASSQIVAFADGSSLKPSSIVWATGFRGDYSWIKLPVLDGQGRPVQQSVTAVQGLYFLGLSWQRTRGSALLAGRITQRIQTQPRGREPHGTTLVEPV